MADLILTAASILISSLLGAPFLWIAGRLMVGGKKARLVDAVWIYFLSNLVSTLMVDYVLGPLGWVLQIFIMLFLIKKYFETSWWKALVISILATLIAVLVGILIVAVGLSMLFG